MSTPGTRSLYRSRKGVLFGVCRGFAETNNMSVGGVRLVVVLFFFLAG